MYIKNRVISVQTVSGAQQKDFTQMKTKLRTSQGFIRNCNSIVVGSIGEEEAMVKEYLEELVSLFRMYTANKEYFLSRVSEHPIEIQMLVGLRGQESLLTTVRVEQINWELPNATFQRNPADQQLLLVKKFGYQPSTLTIPR